MTDRAGTLKVMVLAHLHRIAPETTGVGKHIAAMINGLAATPDIQVTLLAGRNELDDHGRIPAHHLMHEYPVAALPGSRRAFELAWKTIGRPWADRWCAGADWVYCPFEAVVPVRHSQLAVTVHDLVVLEPDMPWSRSLRTRWLRLRWRRMFRQMARFASLYLTVSEFTKRQMVELLQIDPNKIRVVGNGVEDAFFLPPATERPSKPQIIVIGGLTQRKGGDFILRVADRLQHSRPDAVFVIAGNNEDELAAQAASRSNIRLLGKTPAKDLPRLVQESSVLFFPSRFEGFGIPVLEGMAAGTPVVCSNRCALPEVVGDAAVMVDIDDESDAVAAILRMCDDHAWRSEHIARGRVRAEQFRWTSCVSRLVEALRTA